MLDTSWFELQWKKCNQVISEYLIAHPERESKRFRGTLNMPSPADGRSAFVRSIKGGDKILIKVSANRWLFGHNAFGSNDVPRLCLEVAHRIAVELQPNTAPSWVVENLDLYHIDLAAHIVPAARISPGVLLTDLHMALRAAGRKLQTHEAKGFVETIYFGKTVKKAPEMVYNKRLQLDESRKPREKRDDRRVLKYAKRGIRYELRLTRAKLVKLGLTKGSDWTAEKARALLREKVSELCNVVGGPVDLAPIPTSGASPYDQSLIAMCQNGIKLRNFLPPHTFRRRRNAILRLGVDIGDISPVRRQGLAQVLRGSRVLIGYPSWASKMFRAVLK